MSANIKYFRPGQFLFHEGDPSKCMFLVKKGTIGIRKMKGAAYVELSRVYSNEVIGELSFFDRQPRSAAAVALTEVEVLEIDFAALDKIYVQVPDYLKTIMAAIAERLRKANDMIRRLQKNVVEEATTGAAAGGEMSAAEALAASEGGAAGDAIDLTGVADDAAASEGEGGESKS